MLNPKQIGNLVELQCITSFYELGYKISIPYGEDSRYDFIADINNILIRVQCKSSKTLSDGSIQFSCRSTRSNSGGCISRRYTEDEIDYFCTYYENNCYLVPITECSTSKTLRFQDMGNNRKLGVNYAKNYLLEKQIGILLNN